MIELNLLPLELRTRKKKIELPEIPIIPIALSLVGALAIVQIFLMLITFGMKKQLVSYESTWKELAPKKAKFDKVKKEITLKTQKTTAIDSLIIERFNWAKFLNELSNSMTGNIWLTELSYNKKSAVKARRPRRKNPPKGAKAKHPENKSLYALKLSGSASGKGEEGTAYIARFIRSLKENKDFSDHFFDIELVSIKKGSVAGQDVMDFEIMCSFKPEEK